MTNFFVNAKICLHIENMCFTKTNEMTYCKIISYTNKK